MIRNLKRLPEADLWHDLQSLEYSLRIGETDQATYNRQHGQIRKELARRETTKAAVTKTIEPCK